MRVSELMTKNPTVVSSDMDVHDLEKVFLERRIHGAPVVDKDGRLVGVVSQTDLLNWHYETGDDGGGFYEPVDLAAVVPASERRSMSVVTFRTAPVFEVMTPVVHAIGPDEQVAEAARRMIHHRIHRLVVVDGGLHVLGIISAMDLLKLVPGVDAPRG